MFRSRSWKRKSFRRNSNFIGESDRAEWAYGWCHKPKHEDVSVWDVHNKYKAELVVRYSVVDEGNDHGLYGDETRR